MGDCEKKKPIKKEKLLCTEFNSPAINPCLLKWMWNYRPACDIYNVNDNYKYRGYKLKEITATNNKQFSLVWQKLSQYWADKELEMIDAVMAHFMKTIGITGASLALVRNEKLVYAKGFGKMNNGECEFVKSTTI